MLCDCMQSVAVCSVQHVAVCSAQPVTVSYSRALQHSLNTGVLLRNRCHTVSAIKPITVNIFIQQRGAQESGGPKRLPRSPSPCVCRNMLRLYFAKCVHGLRETKARVSIFKQIDYMYHTCYSLTNCLIMYLMLYVS